MEQLIKIDADNQTVSARDLHEALKAKTRFNDWFKRICEYGFIEGVDFYSKMSKTNENGGRPATEYEVTIDMAKQICMIQRSDIGMKVRQWFIDLEKAWNTPEQVMARALKLADRTINELTVKIEEQKPLVDFANHVAQSADTVDASTLARLANDENIDIGRNKLIRWLKEHKVLMSNNLPYQKYIDAGLMKVAETTKETVYGSKVFQKTVFTGKGQMWVIEKLRQHY